MSSTSFCTIDIVAFGLGEIGIAIRPQPVIVLLVLAKSENNFLNNSKQQHGTIPIDVVPVSAYAHLPAQVNHRS